MNGFEIKDLSGDLGLAVKGPTLEKAFENAAMAYYSLTSDPAAAEPAQTLKTEVKGDEPGHLLVNFINELIYLFETKGFLAGSCTVDIAERADGGLVLSAALKGETFDAARHGKELLIKAATYHELKAVKTPRGWLLEIVLDI